MNTQRLVGLAIRNVRPMRLMTEGATDKIDQALEYSFFARSAPDLARLKYLDDRPKWIDVFPGVRATYVDPLNNPFMNTSQTETDQPELPLPTNSAGLYVRGKRTHLVKSRSGKIDNDFVGDVRGFLADRILLNLELTSLDDVNKAKDLLLSVSNCFSVSEQARYQRDLMLKNRNLGLMIDANESNRQVEFSELDLEVIRLALYEYQMFVKPRKIGGQVEPLHLHPNDALHVLMSNVCKSLLERLGIGRSDLVTAEKIAIE